MKTELKECQKHLEEKEKKWESLCLRCGACCGAYDDPCTHLQKDHTGKFYCDIYPSRFGVRKTVSGQLFRCVPIKQILHTHWRKDYHCPYKK
ncbi:MAG: hypothetical protein K9L69_02500 [Candidatus Omnitrophica bacterium]|nr:hypothetical protein [Candidatus Omnitrophota bacterium]MCF7894990.1 hypothetical protein [Candidatus Omnitrophota bacterium]